MVAKGVADAPSPTPMCNVNFIRNEKVLVSFPGCDSLNGKTKIYLYVDEELFDCSKKDPDEVILTVTWGVVSKKETAAEMCAASC